MAPKSSLLIPLYIYPAPGAWDLLYECAWNNPDSIFTVVVNPHNGPGDESLPDANYQREILRLAALNNIRMLGYVATRYTQKRFEQIVEEVEIYANWCDASRSKAFKVDGIFFDETPNQYSHTRYEYMRGISAMVRENSKFTRGFVVHNPGTIPDRRYAMCADVTVYFEETYKMWLEISQKSGLGTLDIERDRICYMIHSLPDLSESGLKELANRLRSNAGSVFLTFLLEDFYASWSPRFKAILGALSE